VVKVCRHCRALAYHRGPRRIVKSLCRKCAAIVVHRFAQHLRRRTA
jgi:hypothetical protein